MASLRRAKTQLFARKKYIINVDESESHKKHRDTVDERKTTEPDNQFNMKSLRRVKTQLSARKKT